MPFRPKCRDHAIIEAVFGLSFTRRFTPKEIEALIAAHEKWRDHLPRLGRTAVVEIAFGEPPPSDIPPSVVPGVAFDRIKPDGDLEWRLRAEASSLIVNCLNYERWEATWPRAREYLAAAQEILGSSENLISGAFLQYINIFEWSGNPEEYRLEKLLNTGSGYISTNLLEIGALWHLHQGWFRQDELPMDGRMLMRTHMDGVIDKRGVPTVKIDNFLNLQLHPSIDAEMIFKGENAKAHEIFPFLRRELNSLMRSLITDEMARSIGLDA